MPIITIKSLMEADKTPTKDELQESFGDVFIEICARVADLTMTRELQGAGKEFEAAAKYNHAALCYALAANQKSDTACAALVNLLHKKAKNDNLLHELTVQMCADRKLAIISDQKVILQLIKMKTSLVDLLAKLGYQDLNELNDLYQTIDNVNVQHADAQSLLDSYRDALWALLPQYQEYLLAKLDNCIKKLEQCVDPGHETIASLTAELEKVRSAKITSIEAVVADFAPALMLANQALPNVRERLKIDVDIALYSLLELKKPQNTTLYLQQRSITFPTTLNNAIQTLRALRLQVNSIDIHHAAASIQLKAYRGELHGIYAELKKEQYQGVTELKAIVDSYASGEERPKPAIDGSPINKPAL